MMRRGCHDADIRPEQLDALSRYSAEKFMDRVFAHMKNDLV